METTVTPDYPRGLTFEEVWASIKELRESQKETERRMEESHEKTKREMKESADELREYQKETERQMKESHEKTQREMKESAARLDRQLGKLGNRFGEMVEYMVMPNLVKKFREMGFGFTEAYPHAVIEDRENNIFTEVDITLRNGEQVMIVEVKSKPTTEDITDHIQRMEKIQTHSKLHGHKQQFYGAIAGMVFNENEKTFALKNGFYVIEPSGETFSVIVPEGIYSPKVW